MNKDRTFVEFWPFSLETYGRPGVEGACLALQDDHGLDVNCLLLCCWAGAAGLDRLSKSEVDAVMAVSVDWNETVVQPLRQARRALKDRQGPASDGPVAALRQAVMDVELEAEWHEQRMLQDLLTKKAKKARTGPSREVAEDNLNAYLKAMGCVRTKAVGDQLAVLIGASFAA